MRLFLLLFLAFTFMNEAYPQKTDRSPELKTAIDSLTKHIDVGDFTKAEVWLNESRARLGTAPHHEDYFNLRYNEGILLLKKWQLESAEPILMECLALARKSADSSQLVMANAVMSQLKAEQSLYGASIVYGNEALSYLKSTDSLQYYALTSNISISYLHDHNTEKSLQYALAAKGFYEREERYLELGVSLNNIGELYREQFEDYAMAEKHYRKAIVINKSQGFNAGLASNYLNLALTLENNQQMDSARHYIYLSLKIREEIGDVGGLALVYNTLGQINLRNGDIEAARKAFSETIQISEEHQIYPGLFYGNWGLGKTYSTNGAYTVAKTYYDKALGIAKNLNSLPMIADSHKSLYELEREDGDFRTALNHFEAYSAYSDSIRMRQNENEFAELRTRYETDLAHTENMLLKANQVSQNAEIKRQRIMSIGLWLLLGLVLVITLILFIGYSRRSKSLKKEAALRQELQTQYQTVKVQKEELKELNELKNNIFSVLGHDLKAPLTSISSLVGLMNSDDLEPEEFAKLTQQLEQETKAGLISLQNILVWSQAKTGKGKPDVEELSVASVVNECLTNSKRQIENKELLISTDWGRARTIPADKNQFKSIAFNLISNAIKFSPKGGKIKLKTFKDAEGTYFLVRNAGEGISEELVAKINKSHKVISKRGTQGEKGTGIGLRIVSDFAELHGGYLKFRTIETGGTEVEVFFPSEKRSLKALA
ncbi:sensor histidine kinase [Cryomorpha ignava]|uniref:histidine kinase n=1 Tax=Cryomorpha ignava TaxID=101383 RepID=A0A7K3WPT8_9FLAO|nr:tetratricopeptide repeat-containing sensor histidine kinase [Cryomorpha ignava]NEN23673.1 sensor histidine kinase [Cryomorpha ignava]